MSIAQEFSVLAPRKMKWSRTIRMRLCPFEGKLWFSFGRRVSVGCCSFTHHFGSVVSPKRMMLLLTADSLTIPPPREDIALSRQW